MLGRLFAGRVNGRLVAEGTAALAITGALTLYLQQGGLSLYSRIWPLVILALLGAVALSLVLSGLFGRGRSSTEGNAAAETLAVVEWEQPLLRYGTMTVFTGFILALPSLGFALSTVLFIPIAACILGMPMRAKPIAAALVAALIIYLVFSVAFDVPLPSGLTGHLIRWFWFGET